MPEEVLSALSRNKKAYKLIVETYPDSLIARSISDCAVIEEDQDEVKARVEEEVETTGVRLKRKVSSLFKKKPTKPILKKPTINTDEPIDNNEINQETDQEKTVFLQRKMDYAPPRTCRYLNHLKMRRQSLTYRGAMLNINR